MKYKPNLEDTKKRMTAYWNKDETDRCCLAIPVVDKNYIAEDKSKLPYDELLKRYNDPELICKNLRDRFDHTYFAGESIPTCMPFFGTAGYVQYFGSIPKYAHDTIWFDPILHEPDASKLIFKQDAFDKQVNFFKELVKLSKDDFFISMHDNCGIIDGLAELRGNAELLIDFIDNPEFVMEASDKLIDVLTKTNEVFFDIIKDNNQGGSTHSWMQTWSPSRHAQIQCDFSVMISASHFEDMVVNELEKVTTWLDNATYHLDGLEQLRHLDLLLSVKGIDNIQWTPVAGQPETSASIEVFQKIQKAGKGLVLIPKPHEVPFLIDNLSPIGLNIVVNGLNSKDEADELIKYAVKSAKSRGYK